MDLLGNLLRAAPDFRGKSRLVRFWLRHHRGAGTRRRVLPGGLRIQCDLSIPYEAMIWLKAEEEKDLQTLQQLLRPGERFIDCGANIGLWTLVAASAVGSQGKVLAIEPNPGTFLRLTQNIAANGLENVETFKVALGETKGTLPFQCEGEHNISRIIETSPLDGAISVPVEPLDELATGDVIHGLKLDVEGFELPVLKGAQRLLRLSRPWLCVEFNSVITGVRRLGDWPVHQRLSALGYGCCHFSEALEPFSQVRLPENWECSAYANLFYQDRARAGETREKSGQTALANNRAESSQPGGNRS